jgi:hypothetical protein
LPSEELIKLEKAIRELRKEQSNGNEINRIPANEGRSPELEQIWQQDRKQYSLTSHPIAAIANQSIFLKMDADF